MDEKTTMQQTTVEQSTMTEQVMQKQLALPMNYEKNMTPEVQLKVKELQSSIDIHDKDKIIAFCREEQTQLGSFADSILRGVGTKEVGEAGELLANVVGDIKGYSADCKKGGSGGFLGFLKSQKAKIKHMQTKYRSLADNMDTVVKELNTKDAALIQVSRNFDIMYDNNAALYEFLTMAIYAGEQALAEEKVKLQEMQKSAELSGDLMEAQEVADFNDDIVRFERRIYDLKLTRTTSIQQAPQIRNIQKGAEAVSESIKTTIATAIPLWKNQMAMALGMQAVKEGLNAVNAVKDVTNAMLVANSQMNKEITLGAAEALERGVIDIDTINIVNQNLIEAVTGSYEITQKAKTDREEGARQLQNNENELKAAIVKYTR